METDPRLHRARLEVLRLELVVARGRQIVAKGLVHREVEVEGGYDHRRTIWSAKSPISDIDACENEAGRGRDEQVGAELLAGADDLDCFLLSERQGSPPRRLWPRHPG